MRRVIRRRKRRRLCLAVPIVVPLQSHGSPGRIVHRPCHMRLLHLFFNDGCALLQVSMWWRTGLQAAARCFLSRRPKIHRPRGETKVERCGVVTAVAVPMATAEWGGGGSVRTEPYEVPRFRVREQSEREDCWTAARKAVAINDAKVRPFGFLNYGLSSKPHSSVLSCEEALLSPSVLR